ncbi:MAG: ACP S-malonyltransferase [Acidiferrobacterales bacterium]
MTLAFVFPGQGAQSVGMLRDLAAEYSEVHDTFAEASQALGFDLWALVREGPAEKLNETTNTQPAMLAAGVAVWRVWRTNGGPPPAYMAGHSLGEYTALVCADALDFPEAVGLVADRGRFMQEAVPKGEGGMAALIGLDDAAVRALCDSAAQGKVLAPVNYNSPEQIVIAGAITAVERAVAEAEERGAKRARMLPVSGPFHCALMYPAAERMAERLRTAVVRTPNTPVLHNAHLRPEREPDAIREALIKQIESPVRWVDTIQNMIASGVDALLECGPGRVLTNLNRRISRDVQTLPVLDPDSLKQALSVVSR